MKKEFTLKALVEPNGVGLNTPKPIFQPYSIVKEWMENCIDYHIHKGGSILEYQSFDNEDEKVNKIDDSILIRIPEEGKNQSKYRINPLWWHGKLLINLYMDGKPIFYFTDCFNESEYVDFRYFSDILYEESLFEAEKYLKKVGENTYVFNQIGYKPINITMSPDEYQSYLAVECQVIQYRMLATFLNIYHSLRNDDYENAVSILKSDLGEIPNTLHQFLFEKVELN